MKRIYIPQLLAEFKKIPLSTEHLHYIKNVLREKQVEIFNEREGAFLGVLEGKELEIREFLAAPVVSSPKALAFGLIRSNRLSWLFEKATELGVTDFFPLLAQRSQAHEMNEERYRKICIEAVEQCGRFDLPIIHSPVKIKDFKWPQTFKWYLASFYTEEKNLAIHESSGFIVGPEGGFNEEEEEYLRARSKVLNLGRNILRAETAALVVLSKAI